MQKLIAWCCMASASATTVAQTVPAADEPAELPGLRVLSPRCPEARGSDDEIVVCGRRESNERYRLPIRNQPFDPKGSVESVSRERNALMEGELGGLGSCTNIGLGGMTGCLEKAVQRQRQQHGK